MRAERACSCWTFIPTLTGELVIRAGRLYVAGSNPCWSGPPSKANSGNGFRKRKPFKGCSAVSPVSVRAGTRLVERSSRVAPDKRVTGVTAPHGHLPPEVRPCRISSLENPIPWMGKSSSSR